MSDPHDHPPDPAALDELLRAFGADDPAADAPATGHPDDDTPDAATGDSDPDDAALDDGPPEHGPAEIFIVEQEPMDDP